MREDAQKQQKQYQSDDSLQPSVQILFERAKDTELIHNNALKDLQAMSARKEILMQTLIIIGCGIIGLWDILKEESYENLQSQSGLAKPLFVCLICLVCFIESLIVAWLAWRFHAGTALAQSLKQNDCQPKYLLLFLGFYTLTSQFMLFEISMINNKTKASNSNLLNPVIICAMILQLQTQSRILTIIFHTGIGSCLVSIWLFIIITKFLISQSIGIGEYLLSCLVTVIICCSSIISEKLQIKHTSFGGRFMKNLLSTLSSIKDFYQTLLHHIPQGIAILDSSLNIHCTNTALHSILHSQNNTTIFNALNQLSWNNSALPGTSTNINNLSSTNITNNSCNPQLNFNQILQKTFKRNNSDYKKKRVSIPNAGNISLLPLKNKDQQQTMQLIESADEEVPYEIEANSAEGKQLRIKLVHYEINCVNRVVGSEDGLEEEQEEVDKSAKKLPNNKNSAKIVSKVQLKNCCYMRKKRKNNSSDQGQISCESLIFLIIEDQSQAQMVKKLENQNEYKMRMLASVSHELRTPLNCSISMLQIMRESLQLLGEVNMVKENLDPALYSSKLLLNLINDILDFAQLEAGKFKMTSQLFSLKQILQECLVLISIQSRIKKIQLRLQMANSEQEDYNSSSQIEIALNNNTNMNTNHNSLSFSTPNDRCLINSDPNRVRQVVLNLLSNALKFTNKGRITLRTEIVESQPLSVKIICEDTGIGIPSDRCTSIFDNFNKADLQNRIKYNQCGAGLGLSISNQLAKMLCPNAYRDQPITVVSEVGKGSSFSFVILDQTQNIEEMTQKNNTYYKQQTQNYHTQQGKETIQVKLSDDSSSPSNQEEEDKRADETSILQKYTQPPSSSLVGFQNNPRVAKMSHFAKQSALSPMEKRNNNNYSEDQDDSSSPPSQHNNNNSFSARCKDNYINNNLDNSEVEIISKSVRSQHQLLLEESAAIPPGDLSMRYPDGEHTATLIQDNDKLPPLPRIQQSALRAGLSTSYSSFIADSPLAAQVQQPLYFDVARLEMQDKKRDEDLEQQSSVVLKNEGSLTPSKKLDIDIEIKKSSEDGGGLEQDDASMINVNFTAEQLKYRGFSNVRISSSAKLPSNGQGNPSQYTPSLYKELLSKQNSIDSHQNYMYSYSLNSQKHTQYSVPSQLNPVQLQQQQLMQQQIQQQFAQQAQQQILQPSSPAAAEDDNTNTLNDSAESNKCKQFVQQSKTLQVIPSKHKWHCRSLEEFKASQLKRTCDHSQVLVVDDNQFNIIALQQQIMKFHLQVDMAFSGESALQMIKDRVLANYQCCPTYLVVFMDIDMPIMNGYEATILINQFFREQNISSFDCPIIACSAYVSPEDKQAAFDSGMLDYIVKPIMLGTLDKVFFHWFVQTHNATVSEFA